MSILPSIPFSNSLRVIGGFRLAGSTATICNVACRAFSFISVFRRSVSRSPPIDRSVTRTMVDASARRSC